MQRQRAVDEFLDESGAADVDTQHPRPLEIHDDRAPLGCARGDRRGIGAIDKDLLRVLHGLEGLLVTRVVDGQEQALDGELPLLPAIGLVHVPQVPGAQFHRVDDLSLVVLDRVVVQDEEGIDLPAQPKGLGLPDGGGIGDHAAAEGQRQFPFPGQVLEFFRLGPAGLRVVGKDRKRLRGGDELLQVCQALPGIAGLVDPRHVVPRLVDRIDQAVLQRRAVDAPEDDGRLRVDELVAEVVRRVVVAQQDDVGFEGADFAGDPGSRLGDLLARRMTLRVHPRLADHGARGLDVVVPRIRVRLLAVFEVLELAQGGAETTIRILRPQVFPVVAADDEDAGPGRLRMRGGDGEHQAAGGNRHQPDQSDLHGYTFPFAGKTWDRHFGPMVAVVSSAGFGVPVVPLQCWPAGHHAPADFGLGNVAPGRARLCGATDSPSSSTCAKSLRSGPRRE